MNPDMWYVELAVGGNKVRAGCNGKLVWRHTPWLGSHTSKGPVRPLRRGLQVKHFEKSNLFGVLVVQEIKEVLSVFMDDSGT